MSKSTTMLRTRRKDNNVKPNRRLDRKSSRGMLFENEELRLKTININAEVERGQSDIKKLKRENDQLRREIWYLRDEYDKLDKLLREKACQDSSSSSCSSESESCSSCTEESEAVETSQNKENFQKTNFKKITEAFDLLSVVPEENSTENSQSDKNNSNRVSPSDSPKNQIEKNVIQADQSYPESKPLSPQPMPKHFFSPIKMSKANDDYVNNQFLGPESPYVEPSFTENYETLEQKHQNGFSSPTETYPGFILPSFSKSTTDLIVKTDNQNFAPRQSQSSFSNGGNLEELLNDIETISHDILKMSNNQNPAETPQPFCPFPNFLPINNDYFPTYQNDNFDGISQPQYISGISTSRPYKSELNVVLMPSPMQLIGVEKYKNIQKSCESLNGRSHENLSSSCHNVKAIPDNRANLIVTPVSFYGSENHTPIATPNPQDLFQPIVPVPPFCPGPENKLFLENLQHQNLVNEQTNPFYFGSVRQPNDFFHGNYVPEHYINKESDIQIDTASKNPMASKKESEIYNSKTNLIETTASSDHVSSENEENLKFKTSRNDKDNKQVENLKKETKSESAKSPKMNIRRKVSIHFKGKKDKTKAKSADGGKAEEKPKSPVPDKKSSFFDLKFSTESKEKKLARQKAVSIESASALEAKPPSGSEVKATGSSENKISKAEAKNTDTSSSDQKSITNEKKTPAHFDAKVPDGKVSDRSRKSSSASPERKHGHGKDKKCHKKHKKPDKIRRSSVSIDRFGRERSYSICTDRSNILDHRLGFHNYDDYTISDRERTNSLSSCDTIKGRKLSNIQNLRQTGKIPWCGCWGNGCV